MPLPEADSHIHRRSTQTETHNLTTLSSKNKSALFLFSLFLSPPRRCEDDGGKKGRKGKKEGPSSFSSAAVRIIALFLSSSISVRPPSFTTQSLFGDGRRETSEGGTRNFSFIKRPLEGISPLSTAKQHLTFLRSE